MSVREPPRFDPRVALLAAAAFVAILLAPTLDLLVRPASARSVRVEQRTPAPAPRLEPRLASWTSFPGRLQQWFLDHMGLRDQLLRAHNRLKIFVLGVSPSEKLVLGRDQWIFITADRSIEGYRGLLPLSEKELETWRIALESRRDWLAARGIEYLYVLAPSKQEIYPEYLPARLRRIGPSRLDQLLAHLDRRSDLRLLDLRPALLAEKRNDGRDDFTFYPLGTHWTARGALAGVRAMVERLSPRFPALRQLPSESITWVLKESQGDSWAQRLYLPDLLRQTDRGLELKGGPPAGWRSEEDERLRLRRVEQDDPGLPRALVFHDSFGEGLYSILPLHFSSTLFVWQSELEPERIEAERPDVVIQVVVDRILMAPVAPGMGSEQAGAQRAREEFERSATVLLRYDARRNEPPIEVRQDARLVPASEHSAEGGNAAGLGVLVERESSQILLPEFPFPEDGNVVIRLELTSPAATTLDLFYRSRAQPEYAPRRKYSTPLEAGRNELFLELYDSDLIGRLLVRPGKAHGRYVIHALEVRAAPR